MNPRPFTILIVSPDRLSLRRLSRFLEVFGYDVRQATDATSAVVAAEAARPDFLIVDASSGQAVDFQLCRAVRRIWPLGYTYSLLLSEQPEPGDVTAALEAGFDDFLAAPVVFGELLARLRAGARYIEFERRLGQQSGIDVLTGLSDQAALAGEVHRRAQTQKGPAGWLAIFDLDYFQRAVDRLGRAGAQDLLRQVGDYVRGRLGSGFFAASVGEDRIGVLLAPSGAETAATWCDELLKGLADNSFSVQEQPQRLTASCGLTEIVPGEQLDALLARADKALQLAKASGRNCAVTSSEVDREAEAWTELAAEGKLFETTVARDVMHPWPLMLHSDETIDQGHAILMQTGLATAPVVDSEGKLLGIVTLDQLAAARLRTGSKPKTSGGSSSSVRLVRHVMSTDVSKFDETTPLADLMEFFTSENATQAVIVRGKLPRGLVHCHALVALNQQLTVDQFATTEPRTGTSADLLVPDLALAE
jgi:diguanylate cyclase (GGDEF)-like protein